MYHHLLVPLDGSSLSVEVVGNAVGLARTLGARVTFFHAAADHGRSLQGDVEVLRLTSPDVYDYTVKGRPREILAKAEAAARAFGVPCESVCTVSDKPAAAIMAVARDKGCDLIFMASHGHHGKLGMALASDTLTVLMNAGLPVLVSSTGEPKAPARAIAIIRDEHRALAAVLHAWTHLLAQARERVRGGRPGADAGDRPLPAGLSGGAAPSQGGNAHFPAPARAHRIGQCRAGRTRAPACARPPAGGAIARTGRAAGQREQPGRGRRRHPRRWRKPSTGTPISTGNTWDGRSP